MGGPGRRSRRIWPFHGRISIETPSHSGRALAPGAHCNHNLPARQLAPIDEQPSHPTALPHEPGDTPVA